jgi:hypothetical protein
MNSGVLLDKYIFLVRIDFRVTFQIKKKKKKKKMATIHIQKQKRIKEQRARIKLI